MLNRGFIHYRQNKHAS